MYNENLKRLLREDIACHEASLFTTPHLSRIHHAEVALLALLEEKDGVRPAEAVCDHGRGLGSACPGCPRGPGVARPA